MQDDGGGKRVWVPSIALGRDRGGFLSSPPAYGGVSEPKNPYLKLVPNFNDDDDDDDG